MGHGNMTANTEITTRGVKMLLGDPKKAIIKLAVPIVFSLIASGILHITDMIWVSGLGPESLSALGFFVPVYMLVSAIATGIGIGGGTCISQRIGAGDKKGADEFTTHMFFVIILASIFLVISLYLFAKPLYLYMGAGKSIDKALSYSQIMIFAFIFLLFSEGAYAIFRSEGNAKLVMVISIIGVVINIILDPIFIYPLGMGVAGAAWASFTALFIAALICYYWLFIKKITYVNIIFTEFKFSKQRMQNILHLGIPVSIGQTLMALMQFANIKIIAYVSGVNGVAVYSTGLRYMHFLMLPLIGISSSIVTVIGAAHGAKDRDKMLIAFKYSLKISTLSAGFMFVITFFAAPLITMMFTWSKGANILTDDLIIFFQIIFLGHPPLAIAMNTSSLFLGVGKSIKALKLEIIRSIIFTIPLVITFSIILDYGLTGVWIGIVIAHWAIAIVASIWARKFFYTTNVVKIIYEQVFRGKQ